MILETLKAQVEDTLQAILELRQTMLVDSIREIAKARTGDSIMQVEDTLLAHSEFRQTVLVDSIREIARAK